MTLRTLVLALLLTVATAWLSAQVTRPPSSTQGQNPMDLVAPIVISGSDLGFRIETIEMAECFNSPRVESLK